VNIGDIVALECLGDIPGNRFLDGRTANGTVGLAPNRNIPPFSGTRWRVLNALDNFTFDPDISTERRRRLLNRHRVGVSRSVDCISLTDAQKGSLLMAYRRAIQHSTLNEPGVNARATINGSSISVNFTVLSLSRRYRDSPNVDPRDDALRRVHSPGQAFTISGCRAELRCAGPNPL
jgi:hypothetical protein